MNRNALPERRTSSWCPVNELLHKLSTSQVKMLRCARDHGYALFKTELRQRTSHARMALRLVALGLLTPAAPHELTDLGRKTLEDVTGGRPPATQEEG